VARRSRANSPARRIQLRHVAGTSTMDVLNVWSLSLAVSASTSMPGTCSAAQACIAGVTVKSGGNLRQDFNVGGDLVECGGRVTRTLSDGS
jgi:hypothetical protein